MQKWPLVFLTLVLALAGCNQAPETSAPPPAPPVAATAFRIVSGSENKEFEPLLQKFAAQKGVTLAMSYQGSVDIMRGLQEGSLEADGVWPASSLWLDLGDTQKKVGQRQSIYRTPVVLGVKKSVATRLGWVGKPVTVNQILAASEGGKLRFMMTSASQSNSGASAYLGYLYAFAGQPDVLNASHLQNPAVRAKIKRILGSVNRTSGSSGWLKDLFRDKYENYDAMVNYESLILGLNRELVAQNKEPLIVIYPQDGLAVADSPLGYFDRGDAQKAAFFKELQGFLLGAEAQKTMQNAGCRTGSIGLKMVGADPTVFNPAWGVDVQKSFVPIRFPAPEVVRAALDLYQTAWRKPSFTVYCLDYSGSMQGQGSEDLKSAMRLLLRPEEARKYLLQTTPADVTVVIPFNHAIMDEWTVRGNKATDLEALAAKIVALAPDGNTNIYSPTARALAVLDAEPKIGNYFPSIVLMTDGQANAGALEEITAALKNRRHQSEMPVYSVLFGDASQDQLKEVIAQTSGKIFDGRKDLVKTFREVKGYN